MTLSISRFIEQTLAQEMKCERSEMETAEWTQRDQVLHWTLVSALQWFSIPTFMVRPPSLLFTDGIQRSPSLFAQVNPVFNQNLT